MPPVTTTAATAPTVTITPPFASVTTLPTLDTGSVTTAPILDTGDLVDPEVRTVVVDGRPLVVAWADTPDERSRGLMGVDDLGDLDGMLFDLGSTRFSTFTMRDTVIALDVAFFDEEGRGRGVVPMTPCDSADCPGYSIDEPARYALEVPAGSLDVSADSVLELP